MTIRLFIILFMENEIISAPTDTKGKILQPSKIFREGS